MRQIVKLISSVHERSVSKTGQPRWDNGTVVGSMTSFPGLKSQRFSTDRSKAAPTGRQGNQRLWESAGLQNRTNLQCSSHDDEALSRSSLLDCVNRACKEASDCLAMSWAELYQSIRLSDSRIDETKRPQTFMSDLTYRRLHNELTMRRH